MTSELLRGNIKKFTSAETGRNLFLPDRCKPRLVYLPSAETCKPWSRVEVARDWPRDQCVTVAQVRTGHSPLVAAYIHRIARQDSAICPHCYSTDETVEHLVLIINFIHRKTSIATVKKN